MAHFNCVIGNKVNKMTTSKGSMKFQGLVKSGGRVMNLGTKQAKGNNPEPEMAVCTELLDRSPRDADNMGESTEEDQGYLTRSSFIFLLLNWPNLIKCQRSG